MFFKEHYQGVKRFLDPDQDRRSVGPGLDPNCLQRLSADEIKVNANIRILVSEKFFQKTTILLVCDGLDTVSVVYINDKEVGRSVNMFVRYIFDVKHALHVSKSSHITIILYNY